MVSVDDLETNKKFAEQEQADFPMLADADKKVAEAYGVLGTTGMARRWWKGDFSGWMILGGWCSRICTAIRCHWRMRKSWEFCNANFRLRSRCYQKSRKLKFALH